MAKTFAKFILVVEVSPFVLCICKALISALRVGVKKRQLRH